LRTACSRPHARWAIKGDDLSTMDIPNFVLMRTIAQMLVTRANLNLVSGRPEIAWDDLSLVLRLSEYLKDSPTLVAAMTKVALVGLSMDSIKGGIDNGLWKEEQLVAMQNTLKDINLVAEVAQAVRAERAASLLRIENLPDRSTSLAKAFYGVFNLGSQPPEAIDKLSAFSVFTPRGWLYQNEVSLCRFQQTLLDALQPSPTRIDSLTLDKVQKDIRAQQGNYRTLPYCLVSYLFCPNLQTCFVVTSIDQTLVQQAYLACGLERFRLHEGNYPSQLDELLPDYADRIPNDLFSPNPLHYRPLKTEGGYLIWSVGWDQKDDGGRYNTSTGTHLDSTIFIAYQNELKDGDWVWRYPAKK
jgi:hypothetical protein